MPHLGIFKGIAKDILQRRQISRKHFFQEALFSNSREGVGGGGGVGGGIFPVTFSSFQIRGISWT